MMLGESSYLCMYVCRFDMNAVDYQKVAAQCVVYSSHCWILLSTAPSQLALIHKAQELSYKVNTLQSEANLCNRVDAGTLPGGMEAQTQTLANMEDISAANCHDLQNALEASEHMVRCYVCTYVRM